MQQSHIVSWIDTIIDSWADRVPSHGSIPYRPMNRSHIGSWVDPTLSHGLIVYLLIYDTTSSHEPIILSHEPILYCLMDRSYIVSWIDPISSHGSILYILSHGSILHRLMDRFHMIIAWDCLIVSRDAESSYLIIDKVVDTYPEKLYVNPFCSRETAVAGFWYISGNIWVSSHTTTIESSHETV